ncbi:MAG: phage scaffolding protein [Oscillospiraceae bacterium]|nr:phage scaffolding protein [Oscillospiraceae bacterium]
MEDMLSRDILEGPGTDDEKIGRVISEAEKLRSEFDAVKKDYEELLLSVRNDKIHSALKNAGAKSITAVEALLDREKLSFDGIEVGGLDEEIARIKNENDFLFDSDSMPYVVGETKGTEDSNSAVRRILGLFLCTRILLWLYFIVNK